MPNIHRRAQRLNPALFWVVGRMLPCLVIPLCVVAIPPLRAPIIMGVIEPLFDIWEITVFVIGYASTPLARFLLAVEAAVLFFVVLKTGEKIRGRKGYFVSLAVNTAISLLLVLALAGEPAKALAVTLLLALNCAPMSLLARLGLNAIRLNRLILVPPAIGEILFTGRYLTWIRAKLRGDAPNHAEESMKAPGAIVAALALAALCPIDNLAALEHLMRASSEVRVFALGDFNGLAYDAARDRLLATGHDIDAVLAYDASDLGAAPIAASSQTGKAQGLDLDAARGELYLFSAPERAIKVFDTATLALVKTIAARDVSPGDSWIVHEPITNTLILASEADRQRGHPLLVFDRDTHAVVDSRGEQAGNLLVRPDTPIVYLSFFYRSRGVFAYDVRKKSIVARAFTASPMDRMAFDPKHGELLSAAPAEGRVYRFDPTTLELRGTFPAIFGVRVIAVDEKNDCMLLGSLATGKVALMGLGDREIKHSWYLGPWLRSIAVVPGRGVAYVSSQSALFELRYLPGG
ncbi:MAG: hypothetical protein JXA30_13705 [Deltaproteobacteria bacterium]|nr:hypothetical protein [Deltaproteobacteria bacterium]